MADATLDDHTGDAEAALLTGLQNALSAAGITVTNNIKLKTPVDTGILRASIQELGRTEDTVTIGTRLAYARFIEWGTGIYGPFKQRIHPTTKKALYWEGAEHPYASIAGMRSQPFMRSGLMASAPELPEIVAEQFRIALRAALPKST